MGIRLAFVFKLDPFPVEMPAMAAVTSLTKGVILTEARKPVLEYFQ